MKISTEIRSLALHVGEEKAVEWCAKAGFDAWDFSMWDMCQYDMHMHRFSFKNHPLAGKDYLEFARRLKRIGLENGIVCNQSHAPFPTIDPDGIPFLQRAIECTAEAGGSICVIHPDVTKCPEENADFYQRLLPFAKEHKVRIAVENLGDWDAINDRAIPGACGTAAEFATLFNAINDEYLVACLDVGHAEMCGASVSAIEMIHVLGRRLKALHIHDNDRRHDSHQIPYSMSIDFDKIVRALSEVGYEGYFTLEASLYLRHLPLDAIYEGACHLATVGKKLASSFDECKIVSV